MSGKKQRFSGDFAFIVKGGGIVLREDNRPDALQSDVGSLPPADLSMTRYPYTIVAAEGRFLLRTWMKPLPARNRRGGPVVRLSIPMPTATM